MPRLISRQKQIPGGMRYVQPQSGWRSTPWASFDSIVQSLIMHRQGNPALMAQHGWSVDRHTVEEEVDAYNALLCKQMGWTDYYVEDAGLPPPKSIPPVSQIGRAGQLAAGAKTIVEWLSSGADAVPAALAEARARHCLQCPQHGKGDWTSWFTVPAQAAIQFALNQRREWNLSTAQDDQLQVCEACVCPLKLKVHMPLEHIRPKMPDAVKAQLDPNCWILKGDPAPATP